MSFLTLVIKNLMRRPLRSALTVVGIAVGIAAVVALTSLAWGFEGSLAGAYEARGTDLVVTKSATGSALPEPFRADIRAEIEALPHVQDAPPALGEVLSIEDVPAVVVLGWEPGTYLWQHLRLEQGRWPDSSSAHVVALGAIAAEMLGKSVGDTIEIEATTCTVGAIYSSTALAENGAVLMPLAALQAIVDRPGKVNFFNARLEPGTTEAQVDELRAMIKARFPGFSAFSASQVAQANAGIQIAKAMSLATSFIALVVGTIGIMNTILMSVCERLQEIGVLLALGWRRVRILRMILIESLVLSFAGGILGSALGVGVLRLLEQSAWIRGKIQGDVEVSFLGLVLLIALALGALGGLYPAWVGSRMSPVSALRHE